MPSTFTWLDYSEQEKRRMLDAISLLREPETIDELGLDVIRDGFAFGQNRQEDLLTYLLGELPDDRINDVMEMLNIDLSPRK